jgi:hypothetical protein
VGHDPHTSSIEEEKKPKKIFPNEREWGHSFPISIVRRGKGKVVPHLSTFYAKYKDLRSTIKDYQGGLTKRSISQDVKSITS